MYAQMIAESKRISERSGMTEEQLVAFAENPANFTADQWSSIQSSKEKIVDAGHDLAKTIEGMVKGSTAGGDHPHPDKKHPKDKKPKKSEWMRS